MQNRPGKRTYNANERANLRKIALVFVAMAFAGMLVGTAVVLIFLH